MEDETATDMDSHHAVSAHHRPDANTDESRKRIHHLNQVRVARHDNHFSTMHLI